MTTKIDNNAAATDLCPRAVIEYRAYSRCGAFGQVGCQRQGGQRRLSSGVMRWKTWEEKMDVYVKNGQIHVKVEKEGNRWWLKIIDVQDASFLELLDFRTKKRAVHYAENIIEIADDIKTVKERKQNLDKFFHGATEVYNNVTVRYAPLYPEPMGRGFESMTVA